MKIYKKLKVFISGSGSEFNQGYILKKDYEEWVKYNDRLSKTSSEFNISLWNQFCIDYLNVDGYWDVSDISTFTGLGYDQAFIKIYIDDSLFFSGNILKLINQYFDGDGIINSKNVSKDYGKSNLPEDWDVFFKSESFKKRNKKLVTTKTLENFEVKEEFELKSSFDIKKFGLIVVTTDEMGYGIDFGDYILGFTYENSDTYFEFPGGIGQLGTPNFQ